MTSSTPRRPFATIGTRLAVTLLIAVLACVLVTVVLQPTITAAQETPDTPTPTVTASEANDLEGGKTISTTPTAIPSPVGTVQAPDADKSPQPTPMVTLQSSKSAATSPLSNDRLEAQISTLTGSVSFTVSSSARWVNTGIHLEVGEAITIVATGSWQPGPPVVGMVGPDGTTIEWADNFLNLQDIGSCAVCASNAMPHWAALIGYIGAAVPPGPGSYTSAAALPEATRIFFVGSRFSANTTLSGTLWLNFNDDAYSNNVGDNTGQSVATVGKRPNPDDQYHDKGCPVCGNEEIQHYAGDPINTATGNFNYQVTDLSMVTAGEALRFERSYNGLTTLETSLSSQPIGYGWTHNYDMRLTFSNVPGGEPGTVIFKIPHGSRARFTDWGDGFYTPWPGVRATLTRSLTSPYVYQVTTANHEAFVFTNTGRLINQIDPKGSQTTLTYLAGMTLTRVTAPGGARWLDFEYDNLGRMSGLTDHTGRRVGYGYNGLSDLVVVTDTRGFTWTYTYTGSNLLNAIVDPEGHIVERVTYDDNGRAVRQEDGLGNPIITIDYSWPGHRVVAERGTVVTDTYNLGNLWTGQVFATGSTAYTFDNSYNRTSNTDGNGHTTRYDRTPLGLTTAITDALNNTTRLAYDANNHLTQITDARGSSSYYTYTGNLLTTQSDALGHTTIYTYNSQNLLIAQQDAPGRVTQYEYDPWGQRTVVTTTEGVAHYAYDQVGRLITTTDTFNRMTVNAYDQADHLLAVTRNTLAGQPANYQGVYNLTTAYAYDRAGRQIAITDTLGRVNRNVYAANGQLIKSIINYDPARAQNELNQYNLTTAYGYDAAGRQILVTDTVGNVAKTEYDAQSRPVTMTTNFKDGLYDPAHPDEDIVRVTQYDPAGNAIAQIDPLGRVTRTWYDEANRVISTTSNYAPTRPQNDQGEFNLVTSYGYDETGNRVLITDTLGRASRNYYDATGRLISTTANYLPDFEPNYLNQYNLSTVYGYDESGRQYLVTNTLGFANHTAYDPVTGRPLTATTNYADGLFDPAQPDEDVPQSTEYDAHGNPYLRRDAAGRATRTWYDELNRVISVTANYQPDRPQNDAGQYNLVTTYGYDELGNRAWVTDTLGHVTWTQYDALNRAVTVTQNTLPGQPLNYLGQYNLVTTSEYDALGRQVATIDPLGRRTHVTFDQLGRTVAQFDPLEQRTAYAYDVLGNRTVMTDAANHVTRFEYDTLSRLITTTRTLNSNPIREVTHYDALGNRVETTDARGQVTTYGYDALGRTIAITDANLHVTTFTYDALGRRTAQMDALQHTTVYTSDRLGRQIAAADALGNTTQYGYDVAGNRVVMTDANHLVTRYEYDTQDRLSAVTENYTGEPQTPDRDVRTTYAYDVVGNRTVMTNARGYTTTTTYDALNRLSTSQDARGKVTAYGYDVVGNRSVMTDANSAVTLYAYDPLNRPLAITYTADATTIRYVYDAIGNRTAMTDTIGTTQYVFDDLNRLTSVTDPFAQTVGNVYDAAGNRTNLIYPDGKVVTYTYDAAGLMTGVIDWAGQTTAYQYDAANRLITVTLPLSGSIQTVYTYDDANRLIHLSHTRLSDDTLLADYEFTLDKLGNRVQVIEAMEYPGDSQVAALPPTLADAIVEAITGHRAPGLSAPLITDTLSLAISAQPSRNEGTVQVLAEPASNANFNNLMAADVVPTAVPDRAAVAPLMKTSDPARADQTVATVQRSAPQASNLVAPLLAAGDIFSDSFESGNFAAWSAAVTNTGKLTVTTAAKRWGTYGMQAQIVTNTAMYVRNDTPAAEARYRARFYFSTNSITMANNNAHELFSGRNVTGTNIFTVQLSYASSNYRLMAQAVNDSTGISSTAWYPISNTWHFIEIDWKASTSTTAKNGYITLWIDGVQKESKTGIDNDTRRVDEVRLGPVSGIDTGTRGTEYFDAFESRQSTYIGPVVLADFTGSPVVGTAPLTVTFVNASQPITNITSYLWKFGDGYTSTITSPVHSYVAIGNYTVTLTAQAGVHSDTVTKTKFITVAEVIFKDGFDSGNFAAWSAAVTNTGRLSVTAAAAQSGLYGLQAQIVTTTAMYVRDDTPLAEPRYRARFYFHPNSLTMASGNAHYLLTGRTLTGTEVLRLEFQYASGSYQVRAQLGNDSTTYSSTSWFTISNDWHFIEIDWKASSAAGANNGYLTLWIDGGQQGSVTGIDNDTRRVDEARLGPLSGLDSGTSGTAYFDTFEARRTTYIGPAGSLAGFTATPITGTAPLTVTFTNTSQPTATLTTYLWKFGDGYTSTITNPVHSYAAPGVFTVTLTAWAGQEANTVTKTNFITATVKAGFSASPVTGTAPLTVTFTNTSQPAGAITSYLWNFGDGVTSTITNAVHTYAPGYFTVTLTAWSGSMKDIITQTRLITASIKAGFTANPVAGNVPLTVTFTNTSQPLGGASTFSWNFGDGVTSTVVQPTHVYTREGTFGVTLTAKSGVMQDVLTRINFITTTDNTPVTGDFVVGTGNGLDYPAVAYNTTRDEYLVVWADLYHYTNIPLYGQRVSRTGHLLGASFAITSGAGLTADQPRVAYDPVSDQYLVVWLGDGIDGRLISGAGIPGTSFRLSDPAATNWGIPQVAYNATAQAFLITWWSEVDGMIALWGQRVSSGILVGAAFSLADDMSGESTALTVNPVSGEWLATWLQGDGLVGRTVSSSGVPAESTWTVASLLGNVWDLASSATAAGDYLIAWRVGLDTNSSIVGQQLAADGSLLGSPIAIASGVNNTASRERLVMAYRAASDDFFIVWQHRTGNYYDLQGAYVTAQDAVVASPIDVITAELDQVSPAMVYAAPDNTYLLTWRDRRTYGIYARRWLPRFANFSATPRQGVAPLSVTFTNLTTPTVGATYQWNFGDGFTSTLTNPVHTYAPGYYTVTLAAWNAVYSDTLTKTRLIAATVGADFSASPAQGQAPLAVTFSNTSHPVDGITAYQWMFGDGDTSTLTNPVHTYAAQGVYTVTLTAFASALQATVTHTNAITVTPALGEASAIATDPAANEAKPVVAYNPADQEYFVVWHAYRNGQFDIYARRVSSSGLPLGPTLAINTTNGDQRDPAVAYGNGEYLVVWTDGLRIVGQRVLPSGDLEGEVFLINEIGDSNDAPTVDYNPVTGEFLVVWVNNTNGENDLWAQRISVSGQLSGNVITMPLWQHQLAPAVAHDQAGNYLIAFMCDELPDQFAICVQRVAGSGSLLGSATKVYSAPSNSVNPDLAYNPQADEYLVVWREGAGEPTDEVYAQRMSSTGAVLGNVITLGAQIAEPYQPAVAYQPEAHGYLVVWPDHRTGNWQAYGRWVAEDGTPLESPVALEATASDQTDVTIGKQGANDDFYLAYTDNRNGNPDIYGLRYIRPVTRFSATPRSGPRPLTVNFTDQTTIPNLDHWQWNFGDGTSGSTLQNPTHVYSNSGAYAVTLTAGTDTYTNTLTQAGFIVVGPTHRTVINYTYDGLYRLTKADSTGALTTTFAYAYDPVGNRTTQTATITSTQVTNYVYDAANRLTNVNGQTYTWNDNGNLVNDGTKTYTYNQANQLTNLTQGVTTYQFNYNGDGARLRQIIAGVPTTYTQDLAAPLPVVLQSKTGADAMQYVYALGTRPLAQYGVTWEYLLADALGSVRQIVDADGNVTLAESYEPYGSVLSSNGTASSIFGYSGEQVDTSGLVYLRARYMQPTLGIFLARDPWGGDEMRPGSMNGWNYGDDNPVNRVDPSGRFGAVALAKTFGYEDGMSGVVQMLTQPSRWNGPSSTHHWGWMKLLLDAEDGDNAVLRGAIPVYTSRVLGTFSCSDIHPYVDEAGWLRSSPGPVTISPVGDPGFSLSPGYLFGDTRPLAPTPFNLPSWRQQGHYVLASKHGLIAYSDEVGNGNQTDLPDVAMIGPGVNIDEVFGLQGSYMVDKFGTQYLSVSGTAGPGIPVTGSYGEGYLFKGSLWARNGGMHREDWDKDKLYEALTGPSLPPVVSGSFGAGTSYQFTFGPYVLVVYSGGFQAGLSLGVSGTFQFPGGVASAPGYAWDELFYWPAPSFTEVVHQAIASAWKEPCATCQSGK